MNANDPRFNLVDLVKDQLSGGVLAKLPELLGTSQTSANTAVSAAVPALLAALGSTASTPNGARQLASALDSFDARAVSDIPQALSGGGRSILDLGTTLLGNLFGSGALSSLSSVLSRFAGVDSGKTSSLLALLTPIGTDRVVVLTGQVTEFFRSATDTFTGIKDTASAEAAMPKLRDLSSRLDSLRGSMDQLPLDLKARIAALIKDQGAKLTPVFDSVLAMPVVGDKLRPIVEELRTKMNALASA